MNRSRISPLLAGVLVALAIPTGVVVALEAVMVDSPNQQQPPTTPQILPEEPLTGPADPETEPALPDPTDDGTRAKKDRGGDRDTQQAKKEAGERSGKPEKESPQDIVVSAPTVDPLVGTVKLETPVPLTKACAALAGGECPVDDLAGAVEQVLDACTDKDGDTECPTDDVTDPLIDLVPDALRPAPGDVGAILNPDEQPVPTPEIPVPVIELPTPPDAGQGTAPGQTVELDSHGEVVRALMRLRKFGLSDALVSELLLGLQIRSARQQD